MIRRKTNDIKYSQSALSNIISVFNINYYNPIDGVSLPDNSLITFDNRRLYMAQMADIVDLEIVLHDHNELLDETNSLRFEFTVLFISDDKDCMTITFHPLNYLAAIYSICSIQEPMFPLHGRYIKPSFNYRKSYYDWPNDDDTDIVRLKRDEYPAAVDELYTSNEIVVCLTDGCPRVNNNNLQKLLTETDWTNLFKIKRVMRFSDFKFLKARSDDEHDGKSRDRDEIDKLLFERENEVLRERNGLFIFTKTIDNLNECDRIVEG